MFPASSLATATASSAVTLPSYLESVGDCFEFDVADGPVELVERSVEALPQVGCAAPAGAGLQLIRWRGVGLVGRPAEARGRPAAADNGFGAQDVGGAGSVVLAKPRSSVVPEVLLQGSAPAFLYLRELLLDVLSVHVRSLGRHRVDAVVGAFP